MIRIADIQAAIANDFDIPAPMFFARTKVRSVSHPRQYAMLLSRELTRHSSVVIGKAFRRDHSTILNGIQKARQRIANDPNLALKIEARALLLRLGNG